MKKLILGISGLFILSLLACNNGNEAKQNEESATEETTKHTPAIGGMIYNGDLSGNSFSISNDEVVDRFKEMHKAFNQKDAAGVWKNSADTIRMNTADGQNIKITQTDFEGLFSSIDSLNWELNMMIPIKVENTNTVKIVVDTYEYMKFKDGAIQEIELLEEFNFKDGLLTSVRQWSRALPE